MTEPLRFDDELSGPADPEVSTPVVNKHPYADCTGCPLYESGTYVPSTFPVKACSTGNRLAFIGEAPGENEIKSKRVFIGLSGKVLDGTLKHLQIDRSEALITNASACHYPKDEFDKLPPKAIEHCRPRLIHELETAGVDTAVTMGAHAARSLLDNKEGITLVRAGGPRPSAFISDMLVVPTFHPAYALRNHTVFPFIVSDIAKVYDGLWNKWQDVPFRTVTSEVEATQEVMRLWREDSSPLTVDTESGADKDVTFGGAIKDVLCLGIWDRDKGESVVFPRYVFSENNRRMMGKLFMRNGLDGQNLKYDIGRVLNVFLGVDGLLDIQIKGDRMLQSYVLNETPGIHGLDYMGREYLGTPQWKHVIKDSMEEGRRKAKAEAKARGEKIGDRFKGLDYGLVDTDVLHKYNAIDVGVTYRLKEYFDKRLEGKPELIRLYNWLLSVSQMLTHVEQRGIEIDLDYNHELEKEYRELLDSLDFGENLDQFNPNSVPQVRKFLESIGFTPEDTRADTIREIVARYEMTGERDDVVDFCNTLLEHRGASKMMSTYVIGLRNSLIDGAAHSDYSLLSSTGRLKSRNPNAQNTPQGSKLRRQYVARQGKIFVHADFGQAELRVMAWLAKDETLRQMFMSPGDLFTDMCYVVYPDYGSFPPDVQHNCRKLIKTIAYGTAYNRGATAIAKAFSMPVAEAMKIQSDFNAKIPDVIKYRDRIMAQAANCEDLVTVFGRHRRFRLVTDQNITDVKNEAAAHMPQSTANDICLTAAVEADKQGIPIVNLIHDDIMAEVDKGDEEEAGRLLSKIMIETAETVTEGYVPFKADVEVARSYGDFH
jgi:uracil-DNA glycosylase family 4